MHGSGSRMSNGSSILICDNGDEESAAGSRKPLIFGMSASMSARFEKHSILVLINWKSTSFEDVLRMRPLRDTVNSNLSVIRRELVELVVLLNL